MVELPFMHNRSLSLQLKFEIFLMGYKDTLLLNLERLDSPIKGGGKLTGKESCGEY